MSCKLMLALAPLLTLALASSGCNSTGLAASAPSSGTEATATSPTGANNSTGTGTGSTTGTGNTPAQIGETCTGDASKTCLAVHFVTYQDSNGTPVASTAQAATIIHTMNQIWGKCGIGFQIGQYEAVDPTQTGLAYGAQAQNQLDTIRRTYQNPTDELLAVTTGPWGTAVNAWTNMPGSGVYGAVMEASIVGYGGGIIYAHEFGHYLGLDHVGDTSNLMDAIIYTSSTSLTTSQCQVAKQTAISNWAAMVRI